MSTFIVPVVKIEKIEKHPNADTLSITEAEGCPVIFRTGDFNVGDLAVYVPIEAVVPLSNPQFAFLSNKEGKKTERIKAKKLRGIFSMGLLIKPTFPGDAEQHVGEDVAGILGIVKYEEPVKNMPLGGKREGRQPDSSTAPVYDIESHRKYGKVYEEAEGAPLEIVVTEKIHGCNGRFVFRKADDEEAPRLFVGSRNFFNKDSEKDVWWAVAKKYNLAEKLAKHQDVVLYGEVYGQVQDLKYGTTAEDPIRFAAFDAYDKTKGRYLDYDDFVALATELGVPIVPVLYRGPYDAAKIAELSLGQSTLADQIKEGCVIKPTIERWDRRLGRVITKLVGEQYLLRKGGTEFQ